MRSDDIMRKSFLALILATTAITPTMAAPERAIGEDLVAEAQEVRAAIEAPQRMEVVRETAPRLEQRESTQRAAAVEPMVVAQRGDGGRGGGWRGREGGDGGGRGRGWDGSGQQSQSVPAPQPVPQPRAERQAGGWDGGWRGNAAQQPQSSPAQQQPDRQSRWNGGWRGRGAADTTQAAPVYREQSPAPRNSGTWDRNRGTGAVVTDIVRNRDANRNDSERADNGRRWNRSGENQVYRHDDNRRWEGNRDSRGNQRYGRPSGNYAYNDNYGRDRQSSWNRNWRNDNRYNWQGYRNNYRNYYRAPRYSNPYGYGYGYQRFGIGIYLGSGFYGRSFWINDPWSYRLPTAPYGYRWVRYYDDVLLVDIDNGYVVDVIYSFFW
jgi:hypothetical protein